MGLILKILTIFFLFLTTKTQTSWEYYREDISQIDYLTYSESNEYYIASFYSKGSDNSEDIFQDLKNGILIYPLTKEKIISSVCSTPTSTSTTSFQPTSTSKYDDDWPGTSTSSSLPLQNIPIFPPRKELNANTFESSSDNDKMSVIALDPCNLPSFASLNNMNFSNYLFSNNNNIQFNVYLWISPLKSDSSFAFGCLSSSGCSSGGEGNYGGGVNKDDTYQVFFFL